MHIHQQWPVISLDFMRLLAIKLSDAQTVAACVRPHHPPILCTSKKPPELTVNTNASTLFCRTGAFSRFLPTLPYPFVGGDNSPPIGPHTHSPPTPLTLGSLGNGARIPMGGRDGRDPIDYMSIPAVLRPQPHLPSTAIAGAGHLTNGGAPTNLSPLRIRVSSPNRINSDLSSVSHTWTPLSHKYCT